MVNDVKRAYFYAPAQRPIFVEIPLEDKESGDEPMVAQLNLSLYGTRDAAPNWADSYTKVLRDIGFEVGKGSPCNFYHAQRKISMSVHGDDFTSTGPEQSLRWLDAQLRSAYEIKTKYLGPDERLGHLQEVRVLNRVIRWSEDGITYEADQRHSELIVADLGLEAAKGVTTPGSRDDVAKAEEANEKESEGTLSPQEKTSYRAISARLNYLALDRPDIQYAAKEASRKMSAPEAGDWALLKRIGRYLKKVPRLVQLFQWQEWPSGIDTYVDSDWAGCKRTAKSTSGGVMMLGAHVIKSWSTTQATIALSSGEAELYALVKGASQSLGLVALGGDMGFDLTAHVWSDSSAAIGITSRKGLGKVRHVRVQTLWVQDRMRAGDFKLDKVLGEKNVSDICTKHVDLATLTRHLAAMGFQSMYGRASTAPTLNTLHALQFTDSVPDNYNNTTSGILYDDYSLRPTQPDASQATTTTTTADGLGQLGSKQNEDYLEVLMAIAKRAMRVKEDANGKSGALLPCVEAGSSEGASPAESDADDTDSWSESRGLCQRNHYKPRLTLFTPMRVSGAPPSKALCNSRITIGMFVDSKRIFRITDSWHARASAHRPLEEPWIGFTQFLRLGDDELLCDGLNVHKQSNLLPSGGELLSCNRFTCGGVWEMLGPIVKRILSLHEAPLVQSSGSWRDGLLRDSCGPKSFVCINAAFGSSPLLQPLQG